ncbi:SMC family ATPase [Sulfurimonas sp. HSL-1716]|uniref:SMC family ATPase n=1 Tax=Hydrocurvibacter sulfurireducens TaxID=3131937 RepID=UPI0031F7D1F1
MILSSLHLENFKKYTAFDIEFGEGLVGIIGKNGSGKSTIFEAILLALYGEMKSRGNKDLIRNADASAKDAVVVELVFEYEGATFRVVREFRGKTLTANAKLFKNEELITSGAKEVTSSIVKITKMSKDAFMHTLFASQKELTSLSTLKNEDRKRMIRKLLGLEKIDFVENSLIEKSRQLKREIEAFKEVFLGDDEIKQKLEQIKADEASKSALLKDEKSKSEELSHIRQREQHLKQELSLLTKTKEQKQKLFAEFERAQQAHDSEVMNHVKLTAELHQLEHKQAELKTLEPQKAQFTQLQEQIKQQEQLREFHLKKEGILKEQKALTDEWHKSKADIHVLEKECEMYEQFTFDAKNLEQELSIRQDNIEVKHTIERELLAEMAGEQKLIDRTNAKIANLKELGSESACPTCTRPLLEEYDNVIKSLVDIVNNTHKKKVDEYKKQLLAVQTQKADLEAQKKLKDKEFAELSGKIKIIESKLIDLKKAKEHFTQVEQKGVKNKEELKALEAYSYDEKLHNELKNSLSAIEPQYKHALSLETELKRLVLVKSDLENVNKKIAELALTCKNKDTEFKSIIYDEKQHEKTLEEHDAIIKTIDEKTAVINELKVQIARIEGEIKSIQNSLDNNDAQLKKVQGKKDDLTDFEKIKTSLAEFKTRLNSQVAPRISSIASEMYARITKGKYQHIEVSNDFDFFIYDEGKKYPIERFSGGEVDLANLVLRIAISKTLTELSGASSVEFLAFDEVFGSQDENRRMEILEAFHTIKEQYRQIFLISHEMEIKEMFERIVEL